MVSGMETGTSLLKMVALMALVASETVMATLCEQRRVADRRGVRAQ